MKIQRLDGVELHDAQGLTPDFAPSSETSDSTPSFETWLAMSDKPGGYVGQAVSAAIVGSARNPGACLACEAGVSGAADWAGGVVGCAPLCRESDFTR